MPPSPWRMQHGWAPASLLLCGTLFLMTAKQKVGGALGQFSNVGQAIALRQRRREAAGFAAAAEVAAGVERRLVGAGIRRQVGHAEAVGRADAGQR